MRKNHLILTLLIAIFIVGCATQKKTEGELKGLKKSIKDLNARFNGYHNAKLILKETGVAMADNYRDNYNQVLEMYKEVAAEGQGASELDEAIKKSSVVVSLYRQSKWADDAYLIVGKSEYLKGDFDAAQETFRYVLSEYNPQYLVKKRADALKNSKKKKDRDKGNKLAKNLEPEKKDYKTIHDEAMVWLARTYVEQGKYGETELIVEQMKKMEELPDKLKSEVALVESYAFLKQKDYDKAIPLMIKATELTKSKKQKTRQTYILAQLYQLKGNGAEALANYKRVLKLNPDYDMEFRTRLNIATNGWQTGEADGRETLATLKRMSKDVKNEEFRDQIFFVMSEVAMKEDQIPDAIGYLRKSLRTNTNNQPQKADSYLRLAEIYFQEEDYVSSKNYYDSTLTAMDKADERYDKVNRYSTSLTDIAKNIQIIELQDSLLMIKAMNKDERLVLAKKLKKERLEAEKKAKENRANSAGSLGAGRSGLANQTARPQANTGLSSGGINNVRNKSEWWAYDAGEIRKGKRDFEKKWGDRPLEDNWRRSNRKDFDFEEGEEGDRSIARINVSDSEMKAMFADVPSNRKEVQAANDKIMEALFTLGGLYRDRLENERKAMKTFKELQERYPKNPHEAEALYSLYVLAMESDRSKADYYKTQILKKYKNSKYAEILRNPESMAKLQEEFAELDRYYDITYALYENGGYQKALSRINAADSLFGNNNKIRPKFALLNALCVGHVDGVEAYKTSLNGVTTKFPMSEESEKAKEILAYLDGKSPNADKGKDAAGKDGKDGKGKEEAKALFKEKKEEQHYILVILSSTELKSSEVKSAISDYHKKYHKLDKLFTASLLLNKNTQMMVIRRFKDAEVAETYAKSVRNRPLKYLKDLDDKYKVYPIAQTNYKALLRSKKLDAYIDFYNENYK